MNAALLKKADLFVTNRDIIRKNFKWEYQQIHYLSAYLFASQNKLADVDKMNACKQIIKKNTKFFSPFKDVGNLSLVTNLAMTPDPEALFQETLRLYNLMKEHKFRTSPYLASASMMLAEHGDPASHTHVIEKAYQLYREMRNEHPFLTSHEDYGFALMLAMSDMSIPVLIQGMEDCYKLLKDKFFARNSLQSMSHILTLSTEYPKQKCERVIRLYDELKAQKCKYGSGYELSTLGILALLADDNGTVVQDIVAVEQHLSQQKGFGSLSMGRGTRVMYATALTATHYLQDIEHLPLNNSLINCVTQSILAMEMAVIAATTTTVVASSSSSSSSSS